MRQLFSKVKLNRMFRLGYRLAFETNSRKKDWDAIFALWYCAAKRGHKRAQFYLGTCYDHGLGTEKDVSEAYRWFLRAAKQGHMESQFNIGYFYLIGEIIKQNDKKAVHWFELAANQGETYAQLNMGYCYFYGYGVKTNPEEAVYWYKKAACKMNAMHSTIWDFVTRTAMELNSQAGGRGIILKKPSLMDTKFQKVS